MENAVLHNNVARLRAVNERNALILRGFKDRLSALYFLSTCMAISYANPAATQGQQLRKARVLVNQRYGDFLRVYCSLTEAAIRLQAWARGINARARLYHERGWVVRLRKQAKQSVDSHAQERLYNRHKRKLEMWHKGKRGELMRHLVPLMEVVCFSDGDVSRLLTAKSLVNEAKKEVLAMMKEAILPELERYRVDLQSHTAKIEQQLVRFAARPHASHSTQTMIKTVDQGEDPIDIPPEESDAEAAVEPVPAKKGK
jgi:hypothetical protein